MFKKSRNTILLILVAVIALFVIGGIAIAKGTPQIKIHYINVGQGDSEFIELPNGQTMLIDAGNPENGSEIVSYIKGLKHSKIDYLIATHPHADHIGGMATVVNNLAIGKVYMPKIVQTTNVYKNLLKAIQNKKLKITTAKAGVSVLSSSKLNINVVAPVKDSYEEINDYSAVVKITYGNKSFLFMGDAQALSESQITANIKADVLKVGHHGSNTSTSAGFLKKVSPKYAIISVGKGNSYGHPSKVTLSKLDKAGVLVFRTDECGSITITSDGKNISIDKKASAIKENAPPAEQDTTARVSQSVITKSAAITTVNHNITVYITKSGKKYHRDGCIRLKKSKVAISLSDAVKRGYTPCNECNPPR